MNKLLTMLAMGLTIFISTYAVNTFVYDNKPECSVRAERLYFDFHEMPREDDEFRIHIGENVWVQTKAIHKDATGFYTYASNIYTMPNSLEYEKKWKCPYCNLYWSWGQPCGNKDCPGKFKCYEVD